MRGDEVGGGGVTDYVQGVALILGVDRFMSEARAITNVIGNGVAAMVVAKWEELWSDLCKSCKTDKEKF